MVCEFKLVLSIKSKTVSKYQAVLTHKGRSSNSGHYVGWVKQKGDIWLKCDDDEVMS